MGEQQINEYRQPWESDEHWTLRKEFIERFWDDFPEERLLCLAQVYSNVELMGCSYPAPVMRQIRELSKDLNGCRELRGKRKERTAVQFVKEKYKAPPSRNSWNNSSLCPQKRLSSERNFQADCDTPSGTPSKKLKASDAKLPSNSSHASARESKNEDHSTTEQSSHLEKSQEKTNAICADAESSSKSTAPGPSPSTSPEIVALPNCVKDNIVNILQFIRKSLTIQNTPSEILNNIGSKFSLKVDLDSKVMRESSGPVHECSVLIDNVFIAKAKELTKKKARSEAAKLVVDMLMASSAKTEKSSSSESSRIQTEPNCPGKTSSRNPRGMKNTSTNVRSSGSITNRNSGLLASHSNQNSSMGKNAQQNNNLLSNPRDHHDPWGQQVNPNVYQNCGLMPNPWTGNTTAELHPWVSNTSVGPDPWAAGHVRPLRQQCHQDSDNANPCDQFLVIVDNSDITKTDAAASVFTHSANFNRVPFQFQYEAIVKDSQVATRAQIILNNQEFCYAEAENKLAAKEAVAKVALGILRKTAYTVKVNDEHEDGFIVSRSQVFNTSESNNTLTDNNIGCKMLKMMGWSGGGIGKTGKEGIEEPVKAVEKHKFGQGLGYTKKGNEEVSFTARAEQIIQDYVKSKSTSDIIFSTEFSKEERKEIHRIAGKYYLKSNSKGGKGDGRHLIISRRYTARQLLDCLIRAGGRTHKYELIPPTG